MGGVGGASPARTNGPRDAQPGFAGIGPPASMRVTRVILASAHLNHDPGDNPGGSSTSRDLGPGVWPWMISIAASRLIRSAPAMFTTQFDAG